MAVELNHTIVAAHDKTASARFLADLLGLQVEPQYGPFTPVQMPNGVTLDFMDSDDSITPQHYAFLVSEDDFDAIFGRVRDAGLTYWRTRTTTVPERSTTTTAAAGVLRRPERTQPGDPHQALRERRGLIPGRGPGLAAARPLGAPVDPRRGCPRARVRRRPRAARSDLAGVVDQACRRSGVSSEDSVNSRAESGSCRPHGVPSGCRGWRAVRGDARAAVPRPVQRGPGAGTGRHGSLPGVAAPGRLTVPRRSSPGWRAVRGRHARPSESHSHGRPRTPGAARASETVRCARPRPDRRVPRRVPIGLRSGRRQLSFSSSDFSRQSQHRFICRLPP